MATHIPITVRKDHLEQLANSGRPLDSLSEIIWNALDADAQKVEVELRYNPIDGLDSIRVIDNGTGILHGHATDLFGNLGDSWKKKERRTASGRGLHGKNGKGRFRAFGLGGLVHWNTICHGPVGKGLVDYSIRGDLSRLDGFTIEDPRPTAAARTGTEVLIQNVHKEFSSLNGESARPAMAEIYGAYLTEYPQVELVYEGQLVDPKTVQERNVEISFDAEVPGGGVVKACLHIIEWRHETERFLHLCGDTGVPLHSLKLGPTVKAKDFSFTAYLKCALFRQLDGENRLQLETLDPLVDAITQAGKARLKSYFRKREAEQAATIVAKWKAEKIYPYKDEAGTHFDPLEEVEREVFDIVAVNVSEYLPTFEGSDHASKKMIFRLLAQAVRNNPQSVQEIIAEVLNLDRKDQDRLARLIRETSLSKIISAAQAVTDRLNFIKGLRLMIHEVTFETLERDHLHRILERETWVLGEHLNLTNSDSDLEVVLRDHRARLGLDTPDGAVEREGGKTGRVDLFLARQVPQPRADCHDYLVVELKRPSKKIDMTVLAQIKSYAMAVAQDPRFHVGKCRWEFWAIGIEMTPEAKKDSNQKGRASGVAYEDADLNITVWAKTWAEILNDTEARHHFFKQRLGFEATHDSARGYLKETHADYIPDKLKEPKADKTASQAEAQPSN
jgi:hypothetical protein